MLDKPKHEGGKERKNEWNVQSLRVIFSSRTRANRHTLTLPVETLSGEIFVTKRKIRPFRST